MTRKHFEALASELRYSHPKFGYAQLDTREYQAAVHAWEASCAAVIRVCKGFNRNFDVARFDRAVRP